MDATHMLDIGGPVHVVDHGGDGPSMLLVHGLGGSLLDWMDVTADLSRTHHVWSLDLLGFGRTPLAGRQSTISANQHLVDGVIEHVGGGRPVVLVGNSMGGLISIVQAARRRASVERLILVDPALPRAYGAHLYMTAGLLMLGLTLPQVGEFVLERRFRRAGAERIANDVMKLCTVDINRVAPATREAHVRLTEWRIEQEQPHGGFVHATKSLTRYLWSTSTMEHFMDRVTAPTLLVFGDADRVVATRAGRRAHRRYPHWTYHEFADTGHIPQMERPAQFLEVVRGWLDATAGGRAPAAAPSQLVAATSVK